MIKISTYILLTVGPRWLFRFLCGQVYIKYPILSELNIAQSDTRRSSETNNI